MQPHPRRLEGVAIGAGWGQKEWVPRNRRFLRLWDSCDVVHYETICDDAIDRRYVLDAVRVNPGEVVLPRAGLCFQHYFAWLYGTTTVPLTSDALPVLSATLYVTV